jgi:hypothetical protein
MLNESSPISKFIIDLILFGQKVKGILFFPMTFLKISGKEFFFFHFTVNNLSY